MGWEIILDKITDLKYKILYFVSCQLSRNYRHSPLFLKMYIYVNMYMRICKRNYMDDYLKVIKRLA